MKKTQDCNRLERELKKQHVVFKQSPRKNSYTVYPPNKQLQLYVWHKNDQHIGQFVDWMLKEWSTCLDFEKLVKVHKRFNKGIE
jgi:hypothetical protein